MREKPQGCGLEGAEHPLSTPEHLHTAGRVRETPPPQSPHKPPPTSLTCRPAGPCNSPHLLAQARQGRQFRGLQLQRLLASLVSRASCKPQKRKIRAAPRPANAHEHQLSRLWCKGAWGIACTRVCWLITGLEGVILKAQTQTSFSTSTHANNNHGGRSKWRPVVALTGMGRHRGQ